jgi:hypothetical protein
MRTRITVRWFDGFKRDFYPEQYQFGNSYLWMKFVDDKEEWLPLAQIRNIKTEVINEP